jgi:hypothetical protein
VTCEAYLPPYGTRCDGEAYWRVTYRRNCSCWPRYKVFFASEWTPPQEEGSCGTCGASIAFEALEKLSP